MFRQTRTTPRQLHGQLRTALPMARAIQRLHPAPSAREHKAQRSCTVRQAVRRSAAARLSPMYLPMHTTPMRQHGQSRRASPAASETVCSARITTVPVHRLLRSCTVCIRENKQYNTDIRLYLKNRTLRSPVFVFEVRKTKEKLLPPWVK